MQLTGLGKTIFEQRYLNPGEKTYSDRCDTIAKFVSSAENDDNKESVERKFKEILKSGDFVPGGRILFGSGRSKQNLLNCYALQPEDNVESIGKLLQDVYKISCGGGGIGFNFSKIRPRGDDISNIKSSAPGAVSVMRLVNSIGDHVKAGKNRRTALMAELDVTHPDILEFLHVKLDLKELNNFNISVAITDRFIEACENNEDWYFTFANRKYYIYSMERVSPNSELELINCIGTSPEDAVSRAKNHLLKHPDDQFVNIEQVKLKAIDLWNKIWVNSVESGDPGIFNISLANRYTNVSYFLFMAQTNPCGEITLEPYANCCLGHINLSNMVLEDRSDIDWRKLARTVRAGVRFLDNILTVNHYPIPECKIAGDRSRRIGLGTLGLHHMLIKLGVKYGTEKCLELIDRLYETIKNEAYVASAYLSRDRGPFPEFNAKKYLEEEFAKTLSPRIRMLIRENGIRNAVMLTAAPTGTISMVHGTSTGIEPIFAPMYMRRYREGNTWRETVVLDPMFKEALKSGSGYDHIVGAYDITPEQHMAVQATVQKHIDNAISKTINLPTDASPDEISKMALKFAPYLKGMTVYRAGSKGMEPLSAIPTIPENIQKYAMPIIEQEAEVSAPACRIGEGTCGE